MKHSKLPFKAVFEPDDMPHPWAIMDVNGSYICEFMSNIPDKENAEFLAVAANSYYPMLEALKEIRNIILFDIDDSVENRVYIKVEDAIKQAEDK